MLFEFDLRKHSVFPFSFSCFGIGLNPTFNKLNILIPTNKVFFNSAIVFPPVWLPNRRHSCIPLHSTLHRWQYTCTLHIEHLPLHSVFCSVLCTVFSAVYSAQCILHYIILNNGILKSNSSIFPRSKGLYYTVHSLGSIRTNCY